MTKQTESDLKRLYTIQEVAEIMGVAVRTVYGWHYGGKMKTIKLGTALRVPREEVDKILKEGI